jgi:hypothetical protein
MQQFSPPKDVILSPVNSPSNHALPFLEYLHTPTID